MNFQITVITVIAAIAVLTVITVLDVSYGYEDIEQYPYALDEEMMIVMEIFPWDLAFCDGSYIQIKYRQNSGWCRIS